MKTMQECFDITCEHLMTQRVAAMNDKDHCLYRTPGGKSCAVGKWIEDDKYTPAMEGNRVCSLIQDFPLNLPEEVRIHHKLFAQLQEAHDEGLRKSVKYCAEHLRDIAYYNKLRYVSPQSKYAEGSLA